ncbi:alpha/beta hydrolase [Halobacillus litoralis]|uniref:alpha/beta fold hydrolase n=1 Tax=Halobacillus litoralis TaxID=45668 RepID=UPI001CD2D915|nr:alpha/beta hydrolase [Halobacillus litoralis]MCA0970209.1 alpha/beta hydrolase [Halobacillus litoralis]
MSSWKRTTVETERGTFEVFVKGEGPPVAVTHLYSIFNESGDYFAEALSRFYQVYLINLKGCGDSSTIASRYEWSMLEAAIDLDAIRRAIGFNKWSFAGHSTGAMLGCLYGIHYADSLERLVMVSGAAREYMTESPECIYNNEHPQFETMQHYLEELKQKDQSEPERKRIKRERTKLSLYKPAQFDSYFDQSIEKELSAERLRFFSRELHIFDVTRKLPLISCPTLVVCGEHDVQCPLSYSREIADHIPDARLEIFRESNHYPFLEEKQKFSDVLEDFSTK